MIASTTDSSNAHVHMEIEELLPWYVNETLTSAEQRAVEQHLEQCPACREALQECRALNLQLHARAEEAWQPPAGHFDRLMADIDRLTPSPTPVKTGPTLVQRISDWLRGTPSPVRWTLALESLTVAALVLVLIVTPAPLPDLGYETLSSVKAPPATTESGLQVVFTAPMTVGELQALLQDIGGQIVAGPTSLGVYTVAVTGNEPPVAARNRALATLRAHAQVRLAEPLQPD